MLQEPPRPGLDKQKRCELEKAWTLGPRTQVGPAEPWTLSSCPGSPAGVVRHWPLMSEDQLQGRAPAWVPTLWGGSVCHFSHPSPPCRSGSVAAM